MLKGETTLGTLVAIVQLLNYIVFPISGIADSIAQVGGATASAMRLGEIYELPADREVAADKPVEAKELVVNDLSFAYDKNAIILDNINASFPKGVVTGVTGKSRSGKSTFLKIIMGLYRPQFGAVALKHFEKFQSTVKLLAKDKICIIVTHDIATINICDRIYILDQGSIREKGADENLIVEAV